jgi:hypothetical protein
MGDLLKVILLILLFILLLVVSCNLFTTRSPQTPDTGKSTFQLPTSADIVILNLKNAVIEKNIDNYIQCFADTALADTRSYIFFASSEANALYSSFFLNWNINSERQYFNSLINKTPVDNVPEIIFSNSQYYVFPDSTFFSSDYYIYVNHTAQAISKKFSGTLQFSLSHRPSGLWSIYRWTDSSPSGNDSIKTTWSMMKAQFSY